MIPIDYKPTSASARAYGLAGKTEEWVHLFLRREGKNIPFSDGLMLAPRHFYPPKMMALALFQRCCGPESGMKYSVPKEPFLERITKIAEEYKKGGWDMPPLIINFQNGLYELNDGNHRFEALKQLGILRYWVIIWKTLSA